MVTVFFSFTPPFTAGGTVVGCLNIGRGGGVRRALYYSATYAPHPLRSYLPVPRREG